MTVHVGQRKRFSADFESDDTDTDTSVTVSVMDPDGIVTTPTAEDDTGDGQYHADVDLTKSGPWIIRFAGSGTVPAAVETTVIVTRSPFTPGT